MTSVLVVAHSPVVRAGLEALLGASGTLEVVGSSSDDATPAQQIESLQPDVLLIELEADADETLATLLASNQEEHSPVVVALVEDPEGSQSPDALRAGVRAILSREATPEEIVSAIEAATAGLVVLHPEALGALLSSPPSNHAPSPSTGAESLTPREMEVLGMIAEGLGNKTIAWRLGISDHTVKFHVSSIFTKLNASSRTEAVTLGIRQGIIML